MEIRESKMRTNSTLSTLELSNSYFKNSFPSSLSLVFVISVIMPCSIAFMRLVLAFIASFSYGEVF